MNAQFATFLSLHALLLGNKVSGRRSEDNEKIHGIQDVRFVWLKECIQV